MYVNLVLYISKFIIKIILEKEEEKMESFGSIREGAAINIQRSDGRNHQVVYQLNGLNVMKLKKNKLN